MKEADISSLLVIRDFPGLARKDLLLSDRILGFARAQWVAYRCGSNVREVIMSEGNGLIGAQRVSIDQLAERFNKFSVESEWRS